ncbi:MAG: restriction endonuclease [bacterium]
MPKSKVTRTYGPIHFEDLDPHRFEDLVRELIYDYKDWQTIEATGRSGNDSGFDIRAYEKVAITSQIKDEDEDLEEVHPMQGNLWMIQGKREKELGPKRVKEILTDIDSKNLPYGYILAASANFSQDSYDLFREELRKKGVMEFYLWGKAELEDMLHFPKNDRILFTFFGVSLVSKRRSRATEIRQVVSNKNKLYRIFGDGADFYKSVLFRDSKDSKYPYKTEYRDFEKHPRWREYKVVDYHPLGLIVNMRKHFAHIDVAKKEYDYTEAVNLIFRESDSQARRDEQQKDRDKIENYWEHLPRRNQAIFFRNGLIRYDEMLVIDDKGDGWHKFPHIFIDFDFRTGPITGFYEYLEIGNNSHSLKDYKRVKKFPKSFPLPKTGTIHDEKGIILSDQDFSMLKHDNEMFYVLYECDGRYDFLKPKDIVRIENRDQDSSSKYYLRITHVENLKLKDYLQKNPESKWMIERQIGENPDTEKVLNVYEFKKTYDFVVEREKSKKETH